MPAKAAAERFAYAVPHNIHDRRLPVAVAILVGRRHPGPAGSGPGMKTKMSQGVVAGVLASLSGALVVTVAGTDTIALMLHAAWLRTLFGRGQHLNAVVFYSHELDASSNAQGYLLMCLAFPVIGLFMGAMAAGSRVPVPHDGPGQ